MEKNCLVTKYKATVNDNSLLKVGEMFIDIIEQESPTNQSNRLCLNTGNIADLVVEVEDGAANLTLDENMGSGWTNKITLVKNAFQSAPIFVRNGNYRLKLSSKYNLTELGRWGANVLYNAISVDTKYLKYSTNMVTLISGLSGNIANIRGCTKLTRLYNLKSSKNITGDLSDLANLTKLTTLSLTNAKITGGLSDLANLTKLTTLSLTNAKITGGLSNLANLTTLVQLSLENNPNITGGLSDLAPLTALTSLSLSNTKITGSLSDLAPLTALESIGFIDTNISGDIKDLRCPIKNMNVYQSGVRGELIEFVKTQRAVGRTTGICSTAWWGQNITFNGVVPSPSQLQLTWTENTITLGNVTVNQ